MEARRLHPPISPGLDLRQGDHAPPALSDRGPHNTHRGSNTRFFDRGSGRSRPPPSRPPPPPSRPPPPPSRPPPHVLSSSRGDMRAIPPSKGIAQFRGHLNPTQWSSLPLTPMPKSDRFSTASTSVDNDDDDDDDHADAPSATSESLHKLEFFDRISSSESTSSYSSPDEDTVAKNLWYDLSDHREQANRLRREISRKRKELKNLRRAIATADNAVMSLLRDHVFLGPVRTDGPWRESEPGPSTKPARGSGARRPTDDLLVKRFQEMQAVRAKYNLEDDKLDSLEDSLEKEEDVRQAAERRFFLYLYRDEDDSNDEPDSASEDGCRPTSRASLRGIPIDRPVSRHPLYDRLINMVGNINIATEAFEDVVRQRDVILADLEQQLIIQKRRSLEHNLAQTPGSNVVMHEEELNALKDELSDNDSVHSLIARHGLKISSEDADHLRDFPQRAREYFDRLKMYRADARRLRTLCVEQDVIQRYATPNDQYTILNALGESTKQVVFNEIDIERDSHPLQWPIARPGTANGGGGPGDAEITAESTLAPSRFSILLLRPNHLLQGKTARVALKEALALPKTDEAREGRVADCVAQISIESLIANTAGLTKDKNSPINKANFITRWLLHQLRTSSLEVHRLLYFYEKENGARITTKVGLSRWQSDVLDFWERDETANYPPEKFEGPLTPRDTLAAFLPTRSGRNAGVSRQNSRADMISTAKSEDVTSPRDILGIGSWTRTAPSEVWSEPYGMVSGFRDL